MNEYEAVEDVLDDPFFVVGGYDDYISGGGKFVDLEELENLPETPQKEQSSSKEQQKELVSGGAKTITKQEFKTFLSTFNKFM
jgi:hypothetical protein